MTELIFQKDSYVKEFECKVAAVDETENAVILDKTAFYIGGGGQPCDVGVLETNTDSYVVKKVKKKENDVYHYIDGKLPTVNETCVGKIDWEHRYKLMRTHTAMHILCGVVWRDYKAQVTGGDMDCLKGRMDFEFENFDKELVQEIEEKVNKEVGCKRNIKVNILGREEAFQIPDLIRTKINLLPEGIKEIRTVEIDGLDLQADGGTHVKNTAEVGKIKIVDYKSKGKINKRIYVELEE
ncbi:alanyl-tRNA editing protein [Clostridiaceae bacterium UIB06]|uniref:Alanyl-tRNA editing protein n=1 Tax=Clostridium thailandense TaxID=2794346 RepID=A0A949WW14_9CLOT|nr:alanyl-tRNA editing protein [Clostridium thailandense]MBV7274282.1 alanyl-tRNA editing protein [Clostridium thailandense]MCH5136182.1 alanyl-tRNA editing protein [Clostridiaceae bacterium UIB06]